MDMNEYREANYNERFFVLPDGEVISLFFRYFNYVDTLQYPSFYQRQGNKRKAFIAHWLRLGTSRLLCRSTLRTVYYKKEYDLVELTVN
jgi:hypothetical protein